MKKFLFGIALSIFMLMLQPFYLTAQEWQLDEENNIENTETTLSSGQDTLSVEDSIEYASILLIPFEPRMYLSDAERDIAKASKKPTDVNQRFFRYQVERSLVNRIQEVYGVKSLYFDTSHTAEEDLINIYSNLSYSYQAPIIPEAKRTLMKIRKKKKTEAVEHDPNLATNYNYLNENAQYMHVEINDIELLNELNTKYGTELFLFITQFEIKTNYNNCLDIANKIYQREVIWHYSLLDENGNHILGNIAKAVFPSDSNKAANITYSCFPKLANEIANSIPQ